MKRFDRKEDSDKIQQPGQEERAKGANGSDKRGGPHKESNRWRKTSRTNDSSWYHISKGVNDPVGNIPFNVFPGTFESVGDGIQPNSGVISTYSNNASHSTPGVLMINYINSYGSSGQGSSGTVSAVDTAAKALYTYVRHQNSGHANYDSPDLMLYIIAMDEIYTYYLELKRTLAIVKTYEVVNRNIPDLLLAGLSIDIPDLRANLNNYRAQLNLLASKISSLAVPDKFSIFKRHAAIASSVLVDSDSRRAQFYMYTKAANRVYDPKYDPQGGGLRVIMTAPNETFATKIARLETMVNAVIGDEDMNIMSGDILKAFGRESLYTLAEADESETIAFIFDENMLQQIENAMACTLVDVSSADIHQSNNSIVEEYSFATNNSSQAFIKMVVDSTNIYFNSHKEDVTSDDVMEYSRCMHSITYDSANDKAYVHPGSELLVGFVLCHYTYNSAGVQSILTTACDSFVADTQVNLREVVLAMDKFDWHPIIRLYHYNTSTPSSVSFTGYMGDLKKYTLISPDQIKRLNDVALMAELGSLVIDEFNRRR